MGKIGKIWENTYGKGIFHGRFQHFFNGFMGIEYECGPECDESEAEMSSQNNLFSGMDGTMCRSFGSRMSLFEFSMKDLGVQVGFC